MEQIDVYDSERRLTGRVIDRSEAGPGDYRLVVHAVIFDNEGRMLIQRRVSSKKSYPDLWDVTAGGQVMAGESSCRGASRELFEEMGIRRRVAPEDLVCSAWFLYGFDDFYISESKPKDSLLLRGDEVSAARWSNVHEIEAMIDSKEFVPYTKSFIRSLFDYQYRFSDIPRNLKAEQVWTE